MKTVQRCRGKILTFQNIWPDLGYVMPFFFFRLIEIWFKLGKQMDFLTDFWWPNNKVTENYLWKTKESQKKLIFEISCAGNTKMSAKTNKSTEEFIKIGNWLRIDQLSKNWFLNYFQSILIFKNWIKSIRIDFEILQKLALLFWLILSKATAVLQSNKQNAKSKTLVCEIKRMDLYESSHTPFVKGEQRAKTLSLLTFSNKKFDFYIELRAIAVTYTANIDKVVPFCWRYGHPASFHVCSFSLRCLHIASLLGNIEVSSRKRLHELEN